MIAVDTSVVVAAFASWHERHDAARAVVDAGARLVAHGALECCSVLTRLPSPHRAPADVVRDFLVGRFEQPWLCLEPAKYGDLVASLPELGIAGGAVYDALIGATAAAAGAVLVTCDQRAARSYEAVGARYRLLD